MTYVTTSIELKVARVETAEQSIVKAKATLTDGLLIVRDRRSGRRIMTVEAERMTAGDDAWRYGDVLVYRMSGCGCGGTRITDKETTT